MQNRYFCYIKIKSDKKNFYNSFKTKLFTLFCSFTITNNDYKTAKERQKNILMVKYILFFVIEKTFNAKVSVFFSNLGTTISFK